MIKRVVPMLALLLAGTLTGCQTHLPPLDYTPDYVAVTDAQGRQTLIPQACLAASRESVEMDETSRFAPGCVNSFNLLQMVERQSDLQHGRTTGATLAAPVGRAAQLYLEGADAPAQQRRRESQEAQSDTGDAP